MLSFPKKSEQRKQIICLIRNAGHFNEYLNGRIRPVYGTKKKSSVTYYPCSDCKGLYSKKFLFRHRKKCLAANINDRSQKINHLAASQTLIACALQNNNTLHKLRVNEEVFSIMKADDISFVAKSDHLIYNFGEQYLKKHKRKQMAVVCSNKMRELARLLIQFRCLTHNEKSPLIDAIDPTQFDTVIECAKRIGGYDPSAKTFRTPSLSVHIGTSLKQVSELLIRLLLKRDPTIKYSGDLDTKIKEVQRFKDLITSQWTTEISSLAIKNLQETKWNKPIILPLTRDIVKFKTYVTNNANIAVERLKDNPKNIKEYKNLIDATLVLTIFYNRKRIGDVQYTLFKSYFSNFSTVNQEECLNSLSHSEKLLTKRYKRIVTGGKGSKPVVILFPPNIQEFMNVIIDLRQTTNLIPEKNPYLFAYPKSDRWVRGDVAIRKFAQKAELEHPKNMTSNKIRKQIATIMQILNLSPEESQQFAQFMGHTEKTHNEFYK